MNDKTRVTRKQRRYYDKLAGCTIVEVLWDKRGGQRFPVLIISTSGGGNAECVVFESADQLAPGHLRHDL